MAEVQLRSDTKRTYNLNVHLSPGEKDRLAAAARRAGLSLAALVRLRALESINDDKDSSTTMTA